MKHLYWTLGTVALAGIIALGTPAPQAMALGLDPDTKCVAVTLDGLPRECTATEVMGKCLTEAQDARDACLEGTDSWWMSRACDAFFVWDGAVCVKDALIS